MVAEMLSQEKLPVWCPAHNFTSQKLDHSTSSGKIYCLFHTKCLKSILLHILKSARMFKYKHTIYKQITFLKCVCGAGVRWQPAQNRSCCLCFSSTENEDMLSQAIMSITLSFDLNLMKEVLYSPLLSWGAHERVHILVLAILYFIYIYNLLHILAISCP